MRKNNTSVTGEHIKISLDSAVITFIMVTAIVMFIQFNWKSFLIMQTIGIAGATQLTIHHLSSHTLSRRVPLLHYAALFALIPGTLYVSTLMILSLVSWVNN